MTILIYAAVAVALFVAGKRYGARVEKEAVAVALAAFTKAKTLLANVIVKARAEAQAEAERLEVLAKKYL
jgi:hypothetical protein